MEFCKAFNAQTQQENGRITPVEITVYEDRSFSFITKTPPAAVLIKEALRVEKGSGEPNREKIGRLDERPGAPDRRDEDARPERPRRRPGDADHRRHRPVDGRRDGRALMAHGKNYRNAKSLFEREREYSPVEAVRILKEMPTAKFDETIEVHFRLGLNVRHADEQLRGTLMLPHGTGKDAQSPSSPRATRRRRRRRPAQTSSAPPISPSGSRRDSPTSTSRSPRPTRWGTSGSSAGSSVRAA